MNYKKKLTFLYSVVALTMTSKAQLNLSYNKISKVFSITTPAIAHPQVPGYNPYTNAIFETGTGAFFKLTTGTADRLPGYQQQSFTIPWNFSPSDNIQPPFVQINSFYDTIRIPPHATSILNFSPPKTTQINTSQNNELSSGQFIKINTSVSSPNTGVSTVIPGDTMTVAITYKNSSPNPSTGGSYNNSVIAFFYDPSDNPRVFNTIPAGTDAFFYGLTVPAIRKHNGETVLQNVSGLPTTIQDQLATTGQVYKKVLYFSVPYNASLPERNIFLSMAPSAFSSDYTSGTSTSNSSFKAVLIDYKDLQAGNVNEAPQPFGIDFKSRDPNGIFTTPNCLEFLALNQPIDYRIHFENEGAGMAQGIVVTVSIPKGIQCRENGSNMFTCTIGNTSVPVFKEIPGVFHIKFTDRRCYYTLNQSTNQITFTISNARLSGTVESQGINNTFGEIKFKLRPDLNNLQPCMFSNVSIVFDGQRAVTDSDLIQLNCKMHINCANAERVDPNPGR